MLASDRHPPCPGLSPSHTVAVVKAYHEAIKASSAWDALPIIGYFMLDDPPDSDTEKPYEMRNCACGSTIARCYHGEVRCCRRCRCLWPTKIVDGVATCTRCGVS